MSMVWLMFLVGCGPGPLCGELAPELGEVSVDLEASPPVFDWSGDVAEITVTDVEGEEEEVWRLACRCEAEHRRPDANVGCKETEADYVFRHCLNGPLVYGELPPVDTLVQPTDLDGTLVRVDAAPLQSGRAYEVTLAAYCNGFNFQDNTNGLTRMASFVVP